MMKRLHIGQSYLVLEVITKGFVYQQRLIIGTIEGQTMDLRDTMGMMNSVGYVERFKIERKFNNEEIHRKRL